MLDLRTYSDTLFRVDEVLKETLDDILVFDDKFFYRLSEKNEKALLKTFDLDFYTNKPLQAKYKEGTANEVQRILSDVLGANVGICEWWEYEADPYHFKINICTADKQITTQLIEDIRKKCQKIKNVRSVCDEINLSYMQSTTIMIGSAGLGEVTCTTEMLKGYEETLKGVQNISIGCIGETFAYAKNI